MKLVCDGCETRATKETKLLDYQAFTGKIIHIHSRAPLDLESRNGFIRQPNTNCMTKALVSLGAKFDAPQPPMIIATSPIRFAPPSPGYADLI